MIINIRDVNDLPPAFLEQSYETTVFEETVHDQKPILKVGDKADQEQTENSIKDHEIPVQRFLSFKTFNLPNLKIARAPAFSSFCF